MKNFVITVILLLGMHLVHESYAGVSRDQMEKMANGFRNTCVGKTGADLTLISGIRDGNFVEDPKSKCYTKCIMGLMRTLTKQGEIDIEMLVKQINIMGAAELVDVLVAGARKCYAQTKADDACELAWQFTKCLHDDNPSTFFFP